MYEREEVEDRDPCPPDVGGSEFTPPVSPIKRCKVRIGQVEIIVYGFITPDGLLCCDRQTVYPVYEFAPYHYAQR